MDGRKVLFRIKNSNGRNQKVRGYLEKERRQADALERAKNYKPSEDPTGLRERVRRGLVSIDEAIKLASGYNDNIRAWLRHRKANNTKVSTKKINPPNKAKGGKQKRTNDRTNKNSNS
jgi:hypothetical protein